jgi:hypothetical protein
MEVVQNLSLAFGLMAIINELLELGNVNVVLRSLFGTCVLYVCKSTVTNMVIMRNFGVVSTN